MGTTGAIMRLLAVFNTLLLALDVIPFGGACPTCLAGYITKKVRHPGFTESLEP